MTCNRQQGDQEYVSYKATERKLVKKCQIIPLKKEVGFGFALTCEDSCVEFVF